MEKYRSQVRMLALILMLALVSSLALAACAQSQPAAPAAKSAEQAAQPAKTTTSPLKIGFVASLSGFGAPMSEFPVQAFDLAVKDVNDGNIAGRQVTGVKVDDATDPKVANEVCTRLVKDEKVSSIVVFASGASRAACLPIAEAAGIPLIYAAGTEPGIKSPSWFSAGESSPQQVAPLVDYYIEKGAKSFFLFGEDYVYPQTGVDFMQKYVPKKGGKVAGSDFVPMGTTEYSPVIAKIVQTGADTLLQMTAGSDEIALIKQLRASPGTQNVGIGSTNLIAATQQALGNLSKGVVVSFSYIDAIKSAENDKFKAALKAQYGSKAAVPTHFGAMVYDAVNLVSLAAKKANSSDGKALIGALHEVSFTGPRGEIKFGSDGYATLPIFVGQAGGDGTYTILKSHPKVDLTEILK